MEIKIEDLKQSNLDYVTHFYEKAKAQLEKINGPEVDELAMFETLSCLEKLKDQACNFIILSYRYEEKHQKQETKEKRISD